MAKATLVKPEPPKPTVLLELSYEEAQTLLIVTGYIAGNPQRSRRKHTDNIGKALSDVGVVNKEKTGVSNLITERCIYFVSYNDVATSQEGI